MADTLVGLACNDCRLATIISPSCTEASPGGNDTTLYIIDKCAIEKYVTYSTNVIDDIVLNVNEYWIPVTVKPNSLTFEVTIDETAGFYTTNVQFIVDLLSEDPDFSLSAQLTLDWLNEIRNPYSKFVVAIQHNNGRYYVFGLPGKTGLKNGAGTVISSGAALTDQSGITVTLTGAQTKPPQVLTENFVFDITP